MSTDSCSEIPIAEFGEESSGSVSVAVTGKNDEAVIPNTFFWTLTDVNGNVVNGRVFTSQTPTLENWVTVAGLDLALPGTSNIRLITAYGTMNTELPDGTPLLNDPYTVERRFTICRMKNIPVPTP